MKVSNFDEVGQMLAGPPAEGRAALAAVVNAVGKADLQDSFLRAIDDLQKAIGTASN